MAAAGNGLDLDQTGAAVAADLFRHKEPFRRHGLSYEIAKQPKSDLYRDLLPLLNSGRIMLTKHDRLRLADRRSRAPRVARRQRFD